MKYRKRLNLTAAHDGGNPSFRALSYHFQLANTSTKSRKVNVFSIVERVQAGLV